MTTDELRAWVRERIGSRTQKDAAREWGVSLAYLNDFLHGRSEPGRKLLHAWGVKRTALYEFTTPPATPTADAEGREA